jgi:hypothetical protein
MLGFDLETFPIGPRRNPKVIVGAFNISATDANAFGVSSWATEICTSKRDDSRKIFFFWADKLENFISLCEQVQGPIIAHNGAYDWTCISAMDASFIKRIFDLFGARKLQCTYIRTLIELNAKGELKTVGHSKLPLKFGKYGATSLVGAVSMYTGFDLSEDKDEDVQVTYYKMIGIPFMEWPEAYRKYLVQDVEYLPALYEGQEVNSNLVLKESGFETVYIFEEAPRRSAFHYALSLASAWGMRVDLDSVRQLRSNAEDEVRTVARKMVSQGYATELEGVEYTRALESGRLPIRVNQASVQQVIIDSYRERGVEAPKTEKGSTVTNRAAMLECGDELLREWAEVGDKKTIWSTFVPALEKASLNHSVINTSFFPYSETGRISAREPNLLNPPRSGGIRECVVARPGCTFIFCDYEANELRVLSQVLLDMFGQSRLAELYQGDRFFDPHTYMACQRLGISYEEGKRLKKEGDKSFKFQRQLMKCCNFGFPGGMASRTFIEFAKGYGVKITEGQAEELKQFFFSQFPEIDQYLKRVGIQVKKNDGQGYLRRAKRLSGNRKFCQLANFYFQGLAAEGGLTAFTMVSKASYTDPTSPLYGCRPVLFVHDEIIIEAPLVKAHGAAMELQRLMEKCMGIFTPDIPSVAEPTMAKKWWKDAYQRFDENGKMIPADM